MVVVIMVFVCIFVVLVMYVCTYVCGAWWLHVTVYSGCVHMRIVQMVLMSFSGCSGCGIL